MVIYGEAPSNDILGMAGELVWVQRGNATWWPGQILDRDELPAACVPAPKPAVPIILIGREDATVDWYNLDKSKKVKAFRCGEFDDHIEKAKASTFNCSRKAYLREDAILEALELESSTLARTSSAVINNSEGCSKTAHRASSRTKICATTQSSQSSRVDTISFGNESNSTPSSPPDVHSISPRIAQGMTTEWRLKGIRNHRSRNMAGSSQYMDLNRIGGSLIIDVDRIGGSLITDMDGNLVKSRSIAEIEIAERRTWTWNRRRRGCTERGSTAEMAVPQRQLPHHQSPMLNQKDNSGEFSLSRHVLGSDLHNVRVEVKTDFQPQRVPFISLTSKINGLPVVGHPLTVNVLDDSSCQYLLDCDSEIIHNSSEASPFHGDDVRSHGRPPRKQNMPCTKKTWKLSSLMRSEEHTRQQEYKAVVQKTVGPSAACVPLKVVFGRLNADLNDADLNDTMRIPSRFNQVS